MSACNLCLDKKKPLLFLYYLNRPMYYFVFIVREVTKRTRWRMTAHSQTLTGINFTTAGIFLRPRWTTAHAQMLTNMNFTISTICFISLHAVPASDCWQFVLHPPTVLNKCHPSIQVCVALRTCIGEEFIHLSILSYNSFVLQKLKILFALGRGGGGRERGSTLGNSY